MARLMNRPTTRRKAAGNADVADLALRSLKSNSRLNMFARVLLLLFALGASSLAVIYVYDRADATVESLRQSGAGSQLIWAQLLALSAPVLLLAMFAGLAAVAVALVHSRGLDELIRTVDSVNRLRREGEVAISARGLIVAFEEQLATARRAHTLLLWLGRTLFIVTLGLFAVSAIDAAWHGVDLLTAGMGAASLGAAVFAVATKVPRNVAHDVANIVQLQLIVTGAHRQISLLESGAFAALNSITTSDASAHVAVMEVQARIERVIAVAIAQIERYADPQPESPQGNVIPLPPLQAVA
jgi:hypothetical protein